MNWTVKLYLPNPRNNSSATYATKREAVAAMSAKMGGFSERPGAGVIVLEHNGAEVARRDLCRKRAFWHPAPLHPTL